MSARCLKWTFFAICCVVPIVNAVLPHDRFGGRPVTEALVLAAIMLVWVLEDARQRNVQVSALFKVGIVALGVVFLPAYLIRSRGFRPAVRSIAVSGLQFLACMLVATVLLVALEMAGMVKTG